MRVGSKEHSYRTEVDYLGGTAEIEIHFWYTQGCPMVRPTLSGPGEPAVPDEIEVFKVLMVSGGSMEPLPYIPNDFDHDYSDELIEAVKNGDC